MREVTALIPIRNGERYLSSAIKSIEANEHFLHTIIAVDDGSTDSTFKLLKRWAVHNPKVHVIHTHGIGLVKALNLGISETTTDWIARFDVDDRYARNRVEKQIEAIGSDSVAIFSDYSLFSEKFGRLGYIPSAITPDAVSFSLRKNQRTPHPSVMFNVSAVRSVGGYRDADFPAEDFSLWLRLNRVGDLTSVPERLLDYRISSTSISGQLRKEMILKTQGLIKSIGVHHLKIDEAERIFQATANAYNHLNDADLRLLLHFLDLNSALEKSQTNRRLNSQLLLKHITYSGSIKESILFGGAVLKRKFIRHFL
jgi:glycosyltransferase involved in cell wall biosynthesis